MKLRLNNGVGPVPRTGRKEGNMKTLRVLLLIVLLTNFALPVFAQELQATKRNAKVVDIKGEVLVRLQKNKAWQAAETGMLLNEGDIIKTKDNSAAVIHVMDGEEQAAVVDINKNSQLMISELKTDKKNAVEHTLLDLAIGKILVTARKLHEKKSKFEIKTPTSIVGIRGTTFTVEVDGLK